MLLKTSELTGPALDWAVAKASGRLGAWIRDDARPGTSILDIGIDDGISPKLVVYVPKKRGIVKCEPYAPWSPSTDWAQGGPIIEREELTVGPYYLDGKLAGWEAFNHKTIAWDESGEYIRGSEHNCTSPTPLIAAMRCFVASKLGDEVNVPEELCR